MGVDQAIDITAAERKTVLSLLEQYLPGTAAWVYGSRAQCTSRPQSDLDLVVFATPEQRERVGDLREAFDESNLPFRVDLFVWDEVPESFRKQIKAKHVNLIPRLSARAIPDWRKTRWGEIATLEYGRALRGYASGDGTFRVFGTNGPIGWHHEALCKHPSVIVGRKGAYRGIHYSADPFFAIDTAFYLKPKGEMDVRWAFYALLTQDINGMDSGSAIPSTNREEFNSLPVSLPPLEEQRTIAHVLGTLDDKIELNRRMNATLEAMARALFKSWFVDFDPVRAKMEGRGTGLPKEVADLFPDRLVDSELGEMPEGWLVSELGDMVELAYGKPLKAGARNAAGEVPVFGSNGQIGWHDEALVQKPGIVVGRKGNPGTVTFSPTEFFPIDTTFYVVPKHHRDEHLYFLFFALREQDLPSVAADSAVPGLNRNLAYMNKQLKPPTNVVRCFDSCASTMYVRRRQAAAESRLLVSLRDTLLPKLVSGELRVQDYERLARAAGRRDVARRLRPTELT